MLAALGGFGTVNNWLDLAVVAVMAVLGMTTARNVIAQSQRELHEGPETDGAACFRKRSLRCRTVPMGRGRRNRNAARTCSVRAQQASTASRVNS
jgi:hypothetical protein